MRIADWQNDRGGDVTLFSTTKQPPSLHHKWDREIARTKQYRFTEWASNCSTIMWTHMPHVEQVEWCNKKGINTCLYVIWHELVDTDRATLRAAQWVLSPSAECAKAMNAKWSVRRSLCAPYDPGLPFTCKDDRITPNYVWVLFPLYDREPHKTEGTSIEVAGRLLDAREDVVLTVIYNSSTLTSRAKKRLGTFSKLFGQRLRLIRSLAVEDRPMLFRDHDVTMWPAHYDSIGITPLTSIYMGTPVVSYRFPPASEFLHKHNSVPVTCGGQYSRIGVPFVQPDYQQFERCLQNAVINRPYLASLQQSVLHGLEPRRKVFNDVLARIIC